MIAFVEDVAASGGYMIACAADEIVVDPSSIVGSIGVISASFGFDKAIRKIGVERRVHTAGDHKMSLDPFRPEKLDDVRRLKALQKDIHEMFIALVKKSRGKKFNGPEKTLFSGEFWVGEQGVKYGLADRLGEIKTVLRERYGKDVETPLIAPSTSWFSKKTSGVSLRKRLGRDPDFRHRSPRHVVTFRTIEDKCRRSFSGPWVRSVPRSARSSCAEAHKKANDDLDTLRREPKQDERASIPTLKRDPKTGQYRPPS